MAEDELVAKRMKWKFGGKQPRMHDLRIRDYYPNANVAPLRVVGSLQSMVFRKDEKPSSGPFDDSTPPSITANCFRAELPPALIEALCFVFAILPPSSP